jgi:riboflavin kinase/FMN adenylyltransferase
MLLKETGLDHLIILEFTRDFAKVTSREFVENYLVARLHARVVVVGFNHHFGYNREGDFSYLYQLGRQHGFDVEEIPEQDIHNEFVSSTKIRSALWEGNIQRANAYLDHYYYIHGNAHSLAHSTEFLGHPILKLNINEETKLIPPDGVYAVNIEYSENKSKGLLSIVNPLRIHDPLDPEVSIEFCFMNPSLRFTGGEVTIFFHKKIRNGSLNGDIVKLKALFQKDLKKIEDLIY